MESLTVETPLALELPPTPLVETTPSAAILRAVPGLPPTPPSRRLLLPPAPDRLHPPEVAVALMPESTLHLRPRRNPCNAAESQCSHAPRRKAPATRGRRRRRGRRRSVRTPKKPRPGGTRDGRRAAPIANYGGSSAPHSRNVPDEEIFHSNVRGSEQRSSESMARFHEFVTRKLSSEDTSPSCFDQRFAKGRGERSSAP